MAKNGLDASGYRGWISDSIEIDEFTNKLFSEFVIGTPAYGLSKKERGFYEYYKYKNMSDYEQLKSNLVGSIPFFVF